MREIENSDDLEAWLETMPREVSGIIAARIALRVLPLTLDYIREQPDERRGAILLPTLRAIASPWAAAVGSAQGEAKVKRAGSTAALAADAAGYTADTSNANASYAAADAADAANAADAADAAGYAADAAGNAANACYASYAVAASDTAALAGRLPDLKTRRAGQKQVKAACAELANAPLWPDGIPDEFETAWRDLKTLLADAPEEGWEVWTGWYEDRLAGHRPVNKDLELERILIPDNDWKQGPAHVNGIIKSLIEKHAPAPTGAKADNAATKGAVSLPEALESGELRAALTDFELDKNAGVMRMVPFREEVPDIEDPAQRKALENMLSELTEGMEDLSSDMLSGNARGSLIKALSRYAIEAANDVQEVRPGRLWDLGATLNQALWDEDIRLSLDSLLLGNLERMVEKHRDLMRLYFNHALARLRQVDDVALADGVTPESALPLMSAKITEIEATDASELPPPSIEVITIMQERVDEIGEILERLHLRNDPKLAEEMRPSLLRKVKSLGLTMLRYGFRTAETSAIGYTLASGVNHFHPGTWKLLADLFQKVPWPF